MLSFAVSAQEKDKTLPKANEEYTAKKFAEAEANYRISNSRFPKRSVAPYNLGNAIYRQNQIAEAKLAYGNAIENIKSRPQKHKLYHNIGNTFMKEKNYSAAVEAYKNALRNNPADEETRYNLALAKQKLKENPPKGDDKKDNKDDKKKDDKDKKDDKEKDKEKEKEKPSDNGDKKDNKPQEGQSKPKPAPGGISPQRLENLLDAVNNEEKKVQDKVNAKKGKGKTIQAEKDW
jgi:tetratricopeptide (TPR) repeat protein